MIKQLSTIVFLLIMLVCPIFIFFQPKETVDETENRTKAAFPTTFSLKFAQDFERFYEDNFPLRKHLIRKFYSIRKSIKDNPKVIVGEDGYLFYNSSPFNLYAKHDNSVGDFTGKSLLDEKNNQLFLDFIQSQNKYFKDKNIGFRIAIIPNKMTVYPKYLPQSYQNLKASFNRYDQTKQTFDASKISFLDLRSIFLNASNREFLFLKTDTHWTHQGAYLAAKEIIQTFGVTLPQEKSVTFEMVACGDVHRMSGVSGKCSDTNAVPVIDFGSYANAQCSDPEKEIAICTNAHALTDKTVFILRDSFSNLLIPYLSKAFKRIVAVWPARVENDKIFSMIDQEKPDFVLIIYAERNIQLLTKNPPIQEK